MTLNFQGILSWGRNKNKNIRIRLETALSGTTVKLPKMGNFSLKFLWPEAGICVLFSLKQITWILPFIVSKELMLKNLTKTKSVNSNYWMESNFWKSNKITGQMMTWKIANRTLKKPELTNLRGKIDRL